MRSDTWSDKLSEWGCAACLWAIALGIIAVLWTAALWTLRRAEPVVLTCPCLRERGLCECLTVSPENR